MSTNAVTPPAQLRAAWFARVSAVILEGLDGHPVLESERFRSDLGDLDLLRAALVTRVLQRLVSGDSDSDVSAWLGSCEVFVAPAPEGELRDSLVHLVRSRFESQTVWGHPRPWELGIHAWNPEGVADCFLQYWASQRSAIVGRERLRHELIGCWGIRDEKTLQAWTCLSARPFGNVLGSPTRLVTGNKAVADHAQKYLAHPVADFEVARWEESLGWVGAEIGHLHSLGEAMERAQFALAAQGEASELTGLPVLEYSVWASLRDAFIRMRDASFEAVNLLTGYERALLMARDTDQVFEDDCLNVYTAHFSRNTRFAQDETGPSSWGTLPWLSVVVEEQDQVEAARRALEWGTHPLVVKLPETDEAPLILSIDAPVLASVRATASFWFYPRHAQELCQLLAMARRGRVCAEFIVEPADDAVDAANPDRFLGIRHFELDTEMAETLRGWALSGLRTLLPEGPGQPGSGPLSGLLPHLTGRNLWPSPDLWRSYASDASGAR